MRFLPIFIALFIATITTAQVPTPLFETSGGTQSPTYAATIAWWKALDAASPMVQMKEAGPTDAGFPLHIILVSSDKDFDVASLHQKKKNIIFINNGIHPGEPDGIDASMLLVRNIVEKKTALPSNIVLAIIPVYNIGGAINRSKNYRIDQNGPVEKGFRGNSENFDLNRDFIKLDSKEAASFAQLFTTLNPDVFIDNHVSNGADYQHVMTLLTSQHNKLGGAMGEFLDKTFDPALYPQMKAKGFDLVPYVNHFGETPDKGWPQFWDPPRYSSGYATLWNTFAFVPETHMLKSYKQRVESTLALMESFIEFTALHGKEITALREKTAAEQATQTSFPIAWKWDKTASTSILFKGYEAGEKVSLVSGRPRLYYDRTKPYVKQVPFYNTYVDTLRVTKPKAYLMPQGWWKVADRLKLNNIAVQTLKKDTLIEVETYQIESYTSGARPYEGHHPNHDVTVSKTMQKVAFRKGDYYIPVTGAGTRFLIEVLEPQAEDSYFAWNFFDAILGQKEGYSDYVFEETAAAFLQTHPEVKKALEEKKGSDSSFAKNGAAQLDFVFRHSPYYEPAHNQYPVYRLMR